MSFVRILLIMAYWSLGLSCIQRAMTFLPSIELEPIPGPPIITENGASIGWVIAWFILWTLAGILLIAGPVFGTKVILFSTPTEHTNTQFRLDDLGFLLYSALMITWGLSYYLDWFTHVINGLSSTAYASGGVLLSMGIFVFAVWAISLTRRASLGNSSV